ncbi:MAG: phosphoribosylamine--glycine ligase [Treponema sp.]|jgi:phosphoribosylamine--glycine ligase|nr:phosphoribosylamine--glycine ligase [Treponema sp.]
MKILIIGSGGREHALAWKCAQSSNVEQVFVAPGNGGTATEAKCKNISLGDPATVEGQEALKQCALREKIDLTVIGPELPLATGIADTFRSTGLAVIGPGKQAAQLEASKIYSKAFMAKYGVRAAKSSNFTDFESARSFAAEHFNAGDAAGMAAPLVIKADGLAAGKGVVIAENLPEAEAALVSLMRDKSLGDAGNSVLLEEFLEGKEVSVLAAVSVTGGKGYILPFIPARDHKRRFDEGRGPNTGGMGAIAPVPDFSQAAHNDFMRSILEPTLKGIKAEGLDYCGFIFFGLMVRSDRCYLLEYNVRLGDPETQAVLPLMDFDLVDLCNAMLTGQDFSASFKWKQGAVCAPVAVADGYPGSYRKGDPIAIDTATLEKTGAKVFVSGASAEGEVPTLRTSGGRVLTVSAWGADAAEAYANAYHGIEAVSFEGMGFRSDIGR